MASTRPEHIGNRPQTSHLVYQSDRPQAINDPEDRENGVRLYRSRKAAVMRYINATVVHGDLNYKFNIESVWQFMARDIRLKMCATMILNVPVIRSPDLDVHHPDNVKGFIEKKQEINNGANYDAPRCGNNQNPREYLESRIRHYLSKEGKKDKYVVNDATYKQEKSESNAQEMVEISQLPIDLTVDVSQQLHNAQSDSSYCKILAKAVQLMTPAQQNQYVNEINKDFYAYVMNENTCYVVKCLVKNSEMIVKLSKILIFKGLDTMLEKIHTCRLVYTLCIYSEKFRENLLFTVKSSFKKLVSTVQGAILINLLVNNIQDFKKCKFVELELNRDFDLVKREYFCRAFTSYMQRCPEETLCKLASIIESNVVYLINDNYGNYLLQIFFDRQCIPGMAICTALLIKDYRKSFVRRYARYVLLKALQRDDADKLVYSILDKLIHDSAGILVVCRIKFSQNLLLVALLRLKSAICIRKYVMAILDACYHLQGKASRNKGHILNTFVHDLKIIHSDADTLAQGL